jgi:hypothetical protein
MSWLFSFLFYFLLTSSLTKIPMAFASQLNSPLSQEWESYLYRPDILTIPSRQHDLGEKWISVKKAHFSFIASLLAFYDEKTHFYFIARDTEYLYDTARLVTQHTVDSQRIHLINVSRANVKDSLLQDYLIQEGFSLQELLKGKQILLIDTGFYGSIIRTLRQMFPPEVHSQILGQLIISSNSENISSRSFLAHMNPASVNRYHPSILRPDISYYEALPKYTNRSSLFVRDQTTGLIHPLSEKTISLQSVEEGFKLRELSFQYMEDLKSHWDKKETQKQFYKELKQLRWLLHTAYKNNAEFFIKKRMDMVHADSFNHTLLESHIRDLEEFGRKSSPVTFSINLKELDLLEESVPWASKRKQLIKDNRKKWFEILNNPEKKIPELITEKKWHLIQELIEIQVDREVNSILATHLFTPIIYEEKKNLLKNFIHIANQGDLLFLAEKIFSHSNTARMTDLIEDIIKRGNQTVLQRLAFYTFTQPHTRHRQDLLLLIIDMGYDHVLQSLSKQTFSQPHTFSMMEATKALIKKGDSYVALNLIKYSFPKRPSSSLKEPLRLITEKADSYTVQSLKNYFYTHPLILNDFFYQILLKSLQIENLEKRSLFLKKHLDVQASLSKKEPLTKKENHATTTRSLTCQELWFL